MYRNTFKRLVYSGVLADTIKIYITGKLKFQA